MRARSEFPSVTGAEVMTAKDVGELLHIPTATVYHLAREGQLPGIRFGRAWRFFRPRIEELLRG